jgi:hypothetical protein
MLVSYLQLLLCIVTVSTVDAVNEKQPLSMTPRLKGRKRNLQQQQQQQPSQSPPPPQSKNVVVTPLLLDNVDILSNIKGRDVVRMNFADSYSDGNACYCTISTFDHGIGDVVVDTPFGMRTVRQVCELLGDGPNGRTNRPLYNDIQCGNGPPNNVGDEQDCPGRVEYGREGCPFIGPKWNFTALLVVTTPNLSPVVVNNNNKTKLPTLIATKTPTNTPTVVTSKDPANDSTSAPIMAPVKAPVKVPIMTPMKAPINSITKPPNTDDPIGMGSSTSTAPTLSSTTMTTTITPTTILPDFPIVVPLNTMTTETPTTLPLNSMTELPTAVSSDVMTRIPSNDVVMTTEVPTPTIVNTADPIGMGSSTSTPTLSNAPMTTTITPTTSPLNTMGTETPTTVPLLNSMTEFPTAISSDLTTGIPSMVMRTEVPTSSPLNTMTTETPTTLPLNSMTEAPSNVVEEPTQTPIVIENDDVIKTPTLEPVPVMIRPTSPDDGRRATIRNLVLYDTTANPATKIDNLDRKGTIFDLTKIGKQLTIAAEVDDDVSNYMVFTFDSNFTKNEFKPYYTLNGNNGTDFNSFRPLATIGMHTVTASLYDVRTDTLVTSRSYELTMVDTSSSSNPMGPLVGFDLIDCANNVQQTLPSIIDLDVLGTSLSIDAITENTESVDAVTFWFDNIYVRKERNAPWTLGGNKRTKFRPTPLLTEPGMHVVTAVAIGFQNEILGVSSATFRVVAATTPTKTKAPTPTTAKRSQST